MNWIWTENMVVFLVEDKPLGVVGNFNYLGGVPYKSEHDWLELLYNPGKKRNFGKHFVRIFIT